MPAWFSVNEEVDERKETRSWSELSTAALRPFEDNNHVRCLNQLGSGIALPYMLQLLGNAVAGRKRASIGSSLFLVCSIVVPLS